MVAKLLTVQVVRLSPELAHFASRERIGRLLAMEREIALVQLTCIKLELVGVENGPFNLESRSIRGQLKTSLACELRDVLGRPVVPNLSRNAPKPN